MGAVEFDPVAEGLIEDGRARRGARLRSRELWASAANGGVFLAIAVALSVGYDSGTSLSTPLAAMSGVTSARLPVGEYPTFLSVLPILAV